MNGRKNLNLPDELTIPGGLSTAEAEEAVVMFKHLIGQDKYKGVPIQVPWDAAVMIITLSSTDFPELNGIMARMKHYTGSQK